MATTDDQDVRDEQARNGSGADAGRVNGAVAPGVTGHLRAGQRGTGPGAGERARLTGLLTEKAVGDRTVKGALGDWGGNWLRRMILLWAGARHKWRPNVWAASVGTLILAVIVIGAILAFLGVSLPHPALSCSRHDFGCGVAGGALVTVFVAAAAFVWLILVRVFLVVNWGYARDVRRSGSAYVATAADIAEVVGRDDLCRVVEEELRDPATRRPQVIVGGVGAGKTAVLVRLTERLAERGAVPVAVRLRDLKEDEGVRDLAARRFKSINEHRFKSDGEADRIWRRMCAIGVIVILADGLEEAMGGANERATSVRQALDEAHRLKFPLVITSRPDDALVTLDAALIELGPLDEQDALAYVLRSRARPGASEVGNETLRDLMSAAKVAEMPLYLQLTRDLYCDDLLTPADLNDLDDEHRLDIRLRLLENWTNRVEEGWLQRDASMTVKHRKNTIAKLSAMAAAALVQDTLELKFKSLKAVGEPSSADRPRAGAEPKLLVPIDAREARTDANLGARLGIVETLSAGVRFRHSIMQAYLGSRWIREQMLDQAAFCPYLTEGLENGGREFLMALTMASAGLARRGGDEARASGVLRGITQALCTAARVGECPEDRKVLLLAAAYEIDRMIADSPAGVLGHTCLAAWPKDSVGPRVVEAKGLAVDRIAEVRSEDAYRILYELCLIEPNYRVRVAGAQYLGSGGDVASCALKQALEDVCDDARGAKEDRFAHATTGQARSFALQGWILPLLAATTEGEEREHVLSLLDDWVEVCDGTPAALGACLAQGLKYEANRALGRGADRSAREHLVEQAEALLEKTDYWYTRMTLLHAMTLWMLSESPRPSDDQRQRLARWSGAHVHPFVSAAAELCARALETRNPSPYIWIDEAGIATKLGQQAAIADTRVDTSLRLPDSLGWVALKPRAVRLVADALLMLNLTDGEQPLDHRRANTSAASQFRRIRQASRPTLPPCLIRSGERACLSVLGDDGSWVLPGVKCAGACEFRLCPYPETGRTLRPEFTEAFCRHVANVKGRSEWQEMEKQELRAFWRTMERRARAG